MLMKSRHVVVDIWRFIFVLFSLYSSGIPRLQADPAGAGNSERQGGPVGPCGDVIKQSCIWSTKSSLPQPTKLASVWPPASGALPVLLVPGHPAAAEALQGFALTLQRLVLANVSVAAPDAAGVPKLWPLGLYTATGSSLSLWDVRLVVSPEQFQQYLQYFSSPAGQQFFMRPADSPWDMHTDGQSFIHIPEWTDQVTELHSVTLISGPCSPGSTAAYLLPAQSAAAAAAAVFNSCNVRTVDNTTLVPTLLKDAAVSTQQPLLVLIVSNVSLGEGLQPGEINIWRPVVMVGLWTIPTSVDLGMQVNQLNVTRDNSVIYWQSLLLENAAPGDAVSSTMAAPYSAAVSANLWAMQCNRSRQGVGCLNLHNTTTILASQQEMDYTTFMYSMFNSPLPNMRQHTDFYQTELNCTILDMGPGPNGYGMSLYNMSCSAWKIRNGVYTTQPVVRVAPQLPFPAWGPKIRQSTQAAPWVEAVDSCSSLQAAMQAPSEENRLHVWMLLNNISISPGGDSSCWQYRDVKYTTQIYGEVQGSDSTSANQLQQAQAPLDVSQRDGVDFDVFALSLGYKRSAFQLPEGAADRFMQIQNVTLQQLPQGPQAHLADGIKAGQGGDGPSSPDIWTLLLWSFNRSMSDAPLYLSDVQLMLPQSEWEFVANTARTSASFVVQLAGTVGLAFTSASVMGETVRITSLQGPGISGNNIWLLLDRTAATSMPNGYAWPLSVAAAPTGSRSGSEAAQSRTAVVKAAVGASIGGAALLILLCFCWWWCMRRRRQREQHVVYAASAACSKTSGAGDGMPVLEQHAGGAVGAPDSPGPYVSVDVGHLPDVHNPGDDKLPVTIARKSGKPGSASSAQDISLLHGLSESEARSSAVAGSGSAAGSHSGGSDPNSNTVASGLQRWKTAISTTTMQLMERRMQSLHSTPPGTSSTSGRTGASVESHMTSPARPASAGSRIPSAGAAAAAAAKGGRGSQPVQLPLQAPPSLQLQGVLGQGSFGCVYLGIWHGKRVAVKVMQLPANALLDPQRSAAHNSQLSPEELQRRQRKQAQSNSPPHMAIMETVVSSTMSHPNVVQVYTYMLNPLTVDEAPNSTEDIGADPLQAQQQAASAAARGTVSGWELKLVMEYCDQGTLREALDQRTLIRGNGVSCLQPALVLSLAHDVAAALLHLHTEGVVHGDLKAANVLLTKGGEDVEGIWAATVGYRVTAKVADFGLALQLDPNDTHASMAARGTPTHMSPELFMSGHVSKASDVYAYGILLYEIMTGQRAYAGVPIPLLPHEVARQGLRPTWPSQLPAGYRDLKRLAVACWQQHPQDRPSLLEVFSFLECCQAGRSPPLLRSEQLQAVPEQHSAQQIDGSTALSREQQLQTPQQIAELRQQISVVPQYSNAAAAQQNDAAKGEMAWSEVTYEGMKANEQ